MTVLLVALAGAAGVVTRYLIGEALVTIWATVGINVLGSFLLGLLVHLGGSWNPDVRTALGVGFLGGFTTFSTFTVQVVLEAEGGNTDKAFLYLATSVVLGLAAAVAGYMLGRRLA